jgi:hypothetical protein
MLDDAGISSDGGDLGETSMITWVGDERERKRGKKGESRGK